MSNRNIKKLSKKYSKENQELGELFLEVSDFKKRREKRVVPKKEDIEEKHYLEQLTRRQHVIHKEYANFIEKLKNHPLLKNKISESLIRYIFRDLRFSKHLHKKNFSPEEIGTLIIEEISKQISSYLVIFPLAGFIPNNRFFKLGNVVFGTAKEIVEYFTWSQVFNATFSAKASYGVFQSSTFLGLPLSKSCALFI